MMDGQSLRSQAAKLANTYYKQFMGMYIMDQNFSRREDERIDKIYGLLASTPLLTVDMSQLSKFADYVTQRMLEESPSVREQFIRDNFPLANDNSKVAINGTALANLAAICDNWPDPVEGKKMWKGLCETVVLTSPPK